MQGWTETGVERDPARIGGADGGQVHLVIGEGSGRIAGQVGDPAHLADRRRAGHVPRIRLEHEVDAVHPIGEIRTAADEGADLLPVKAGIGRRRHHEGGGRGQHRQEVARRVAEAHHQGVRVAGLDADLVLRPTGHAFGSADDDREHVRRRGTGARVQDAQPRAAHIGCLERAAIAEGEAVAQMEGVGQSVPAHVPRRGERGVWLAVLVEPCQACVELQDELDVGG